MKDCQSYASLNFSIRRHISICIFYSLQINHPKSSLLQHLKSRIWVNIWKSMISFSKLYQLSRLLRPIRIAMLEVTDFNLNIFYRFPFLILAYTSTYSRQKKYNRTSITLILGFTERLRKWCQNYSFQIIRIAK